LATQKHYKQLSGAAIALIGYPKTLKRTIRGSNRAYWLPKNAKKTIPGRQSGLLATQKHYKQQSGAPIGLIGYPKTLKRPFRVANRAYWLPKNTKNNYLGLQSRLLATQKH
jgi:hypothetical protein